jgi:hypothetical protein
VKNNNQVTETLMQLLKKISNQESLKKKMEQYNKDVREYQKNLKPTPVQL